MDWAEEEESPQREEESSISPEELRREMYRILVSDHIITKKDLKVRVVEEEQVLENFVKATSYMLEKHGNLFKLFDRNGAYYEAVKLARRLVEAKVIDEKEEPYHNTPYYFDEDDKDRMDAIDLKLKEWYPKSVIPTKYPFIRKAKPKVNPKADVKLIPELNNCLDSKVEETPSLDTEKDCNPVVETPVNEPKEQVEANTEFITVNAYLREHHTHLFNGLEDVYIYIKASQITTRLAKNGVFPKQEKKYNHTFNYFDKDDKNTMEAIDDAVNRLYAEGLGKPKKRVSADSRFITVSGYIRGKHRFLFNHLDEISELDKAYRISNFLAEKGIVSRRDEKFLNTCLYFPIDDSATMDAIDNGINKLFTEDGRRRHEERKPKPKSEFITVSKYLIKYHPELFTNLTSGSTSAKASYIAKLLANNNIVPVNDKSYYSTRLYFRRNDRDIIGRIDGAISSGILEN